MGEVVARGMVDGGCVRGAASDTACAAGGAVGMLPLGETAAGVCGEASRLEVALLAALFERSFVMRSCA